MADFLHDGPVQELTAATLSVELLSRLAPDEIRPYADQIRRHLDRGHPADPAADG